MAAGYAFGPWLLRDSAAKRKSLLILGAFLTALFVVTRSTNLYGDPQPWVPQQSSLFTLLSFLNCEKYPPSLCYLLMTLGPSLMLLALFDRGTPAVLKPVLVFGRVPLFFYLLHLPLIHGLAVLERHLTTPQNAGVGLAGVYGVWILIVSALYPACSAFADLKRRRREAWLSYL